MFNRYATLARRQGDNRLELYISSYPQLNMRLRHEISSRDVLASSAFTSLKRPITIARAFRRAHQEGLTEQYERKRIHNLGNHYRIEYQVPESKSQEEFEDALKSAFEDNFSKSKKN